MAKRNKIKSARPLLKLEALEQRQLLAGGFTAAQGTEFSNIVHANGNVYDQVLMKTSAISVTNDAGQITRVSFLDLQGDIVQAEFSGAGTLSISLDSATGPAAPTKYAQPGVMYMSGLASFTIQGSDATTNFSVFSVGSTTAHGGAANAIFTGGLTGGDNTADIARLTIVADPSNPSGSTFGGIRASNANFAADSGVVGIAAANVQVQSVVNVGDINASGTASPTLVFGTNSQFGALNVGGGDLLSANGKAINNAGSYVYGINLSAGTKSDGTVLAAQNTLSQLTFTGTNPLTVQNKTIAFTTGVDALVGGGGSDTFNGTTSGTVANNTITAFDSVTGGDGTDTINVINIGGTVPNGNGLTVSGVENLSIKSDTNAITTDVSAWTGLKSVTVESTVATAVAVTTKANATWASIKGGSTAAVTDSGTDTTDVLATANFDGNTGAASATSKMLTTLGVANTNQDATVTASAGTRALTVNVNGVTASGTTTIADATATSVTLNGRTAASTFDVLSLTAATGLTIDADVNVTVNTLTAAAATSLTVTGDSVATIGAFTTTNKITTVTVSGSAGLATAALLASQSALTTVNASGTSGAVTSSIATGVTYTGGSGVDTLTVGASTKAITLGAGNDVLNLSVAALGTGGSIDAGEGTSDTISLSSANAATATVDGTLAGKISNFERLSIENTAGGAQTINADNADGITYVVLNGVTATNTLTFNNVANGSTFSYRAAAADTVTVTLKDATGAADSVNLMFAATNGFANTAATTIAGVETVAITVDDTDTTAATTAFTGVLAIAAAKTITVTGDAGFDFTGSTLTNVTSVDASGVTASGAAGVVTVTTVKAATITGGAGNDVLTGSANADTIIGNAGADVITSGGGIDTLTGGAGNDTFGISIPANVNSYASITDAAAGDMINLADQGTATFNATKLTAPAETESYLGYLEQATAGNGGTNAIVSWFQFGGNTFIVSDASAAVTFQNGADTVVRLNGLVDLSKTTTSGATNVLTIV